MPVKFGVNFYGYSSLMWCWMTVIVNKEDWPKYFPNRPTHWPIYLPNKPTHCLQLQNLLTHLYDSPSTTGASINQNIFHPAAGVVVINVNLFTGISVPRLAPGQRSRGQRWTAVRRSCRPWVTRGTSNTGNPSFSSAPHRLCFPSRKPGPKRFPPLSCFYRRYAHTRRGLFIS